MAPKKAHTPTPKESFEGFKQRFSYFTVWATETLTQTEC